MSQSKNATIRRSQSRYIIIDEDSYKHLSPFEMLIYMTLRFNCDFTQDHSEVHMTIKFIAEQSKCSMRQVNHALNSLEYTHHLIKRLNYKHFRHGQRNSYDVAREYGYFKTAQSQTTCAPDALDSAPRAYLIDHYIDQEKTTITQNPETPEPPCASKAAPATAQKPEKQKPKTPVNREKDNEFLKELIACYHQVFPDNPKHRTDYIAKDLQKLLRTFIAEFPDWSGKHVPLTLEHFRNYLTSIREQRPDWSMKPYMLPSGKMRMNDLTTFVRLTNVCRLMENRL